MKRNNLVEVEYSSNNSGGSWWLKDKDWIALEKAGWFVEWGGLYFCGSKYSFSEPPARKPTCKKGDKCHGHRKFDSAQEVIDGNGRWLDGLAKSAKKKFPSLAEGVREFEKVTGQDATDEGCNCCGAPHSFSANGDYASGEGLIPVLTGVSMTARQMAEKLSK